MALTHLRLQTGDALATLIAILSHVEDRELAQLDTASSDSAFGELADSEPEDGEGPETLADGGDLAANGDTNSTDVGEGLELDAALSTVFLASLAEQRTDGA